MSPLQIAVCCLAVVGVAVGKPTFLHYGVSPVGVSQIGVAPVGVSQVGVSQVGVAPVGVASVGVAPYAVAPLAVSSQYHSQDVLGQYSYGYSGGHSAKVETKTADGITRGGYSYVDPNGVIQSANYVADDAHGFSVAASNLPESPVAVEDTPEVAAAKAAHATAFSEAAAAAEAAPEVEASDDSAQDAVSEDAAPVVSSYSVSSAQQTPVEVKTVQYAAPGALAVSPVVHSAPGVSIVHEALPSKAFSYSTVAVAPAVAPVSYSVSEEVSPVVVSAPHVVSYNAVPSVAVANSVQGVAVARTVPVGVLGASSHQYHAQDALGHYTYGYVGGPSAKAEAKSLDGIVRGGYSYIDANGLVQSASYVADDVHGFRVAATNVPVAPEPVLAEA